MTPSRGSEPLLRQLGSGAADPVLVADFQAFSSATRLSELLSERMVDQPVFQIDPLGLLSGNRLYASLPELAAASADAFQRSGAEHGQVVVVGHCSAAGLALRVADLLAARRTVTAVLVQPSWPDDEHVTTRFAEFGARLGMAARPCPDLDADPCQVVSAMEQALREETVALAVSRGLDASAGVFADLLAWYRSWLAFLLACRNDTLTERAAGGAAVTVLSDSPGPVTFAGIGKRAYRVCEFPALAQAGTATHELADLVAPHVGHR